MVKWSKIARAGLIAGPSWSISKNGNVTLTKHLDIIVSFDSMKMRGSMVLSTEKKTRNRLIGVDLSEGHSAIEAEFKATVRKLTKASMSEENFAASMSESLPLNAEHMVYYARAVEPGVNLCFICAAYNMNSIRAANIHLQMEDVMVTLHEHGFNVRFVTCDHASSNASWMKSKCTLSANSFIPSDVLDTFGLDGEFDMAFRHPVSGKFVFVIADPPHCLKRVGSALENRQMQFGDEPITMTMLHDVFVAINKKQGNDVSLRYFRKLSEATFQGKQL